MSCAGLLGQCRLGKEKERTTGWSPRWCGCLTRRWSAALPRWPRIRLLQPASETQQDGITLIGIDVWW